MEQSLITPTAITEQLQITPITLRRWCDYHREHLSPGANPGAGQARRFTGRDLEVLRHVRSLRDQGMITRAINEQLAGLTFAEIDDQPDSDDQSPMSTEVPVTAVTSAQQVPGGLVAQHDLYTEIALLRSSIENIKQDRREPVYYMALGFGLACLMFILLLLLFLVQQWL